jgi:hypothetical protein
LQELWRCSEPSAFIVTAVVAIEDEKERGGIAGIYRRGEIADVFAAKNQRHAVLLRWLQSSLIFGYARVHDEVGVCRYESSSTALLVTLNER